MMHEISFVSNLNHANIAKVFAYDTNAVMEKKDGRKVPVSYVIQEYIPNGELFDYFKYLTAFPENITRYFFRSLLEAVHHMHE